MREFKDNKRTQQHIDEILKKEEGVKLSARGNKILTSFDENIILVGQSPTNNLNTHVHISQNDMNKPKNVQV